MPLTNKQFVALMRRVRSGDEQAAGELFQRYGKPIQEAVHRWLTRNMRSQFDSLDFTQDAWASFLHIPPRQYKFKTPRELMNFLRRLAKNKLRQAYRRQYGTIKRARHPVQSLEAGEDQLRIEPPGLSPTPSQVVMAEEQWRRMLQDQPPKVQKALEMLRAGNTHQEIAEILGVHPRMVQR
jgi:RNA polymerase sigma-70 factor (ECF subfamily)